MSIVRPLAVCCLALLAAATTASASWSPSVTVPGSGGTLTTRTIAMNARGDVAVGWTEVLGTRRAAVAVAVRPAGSTTFSVQQRLVGGPVEGTGLQVALDRRGELTAVWMQRRFRASGLPGAPSLQAAFRTAAGRWSKPQLVARASAFALAHPMLAVRPDRNVLLTASLGFRAAQNGIYAWRAPGHRFSTARALRSGGRRPHCVAPAASGVDARGRAYVAGPDLCAPSPRFAVAVARPAQPRFVIHAAHRRAANLQMAVAPDGGGTLAWSEGDEERAGPFRAARFNAAGDVGASSSSLGSAAASRLQLARSADGGADVSWLEWPQPEGTLMTAHQRSDGTFAAAEPVGDRWAPIAADTGGDQLLRRDRIVTETAAGQPAISWIADFAVRTPTGALDPAPVAAHASPLAGVWVATAGPDGSALGLVVEQARGLGVTVWRP